jgi:hypothetical protein
LRRTFPVSTRLRLKVGASGAGEMTLPIIYPMCGSFHESL